MSIEALNWALRDPEIQAAVMGRDRAVLIALADHANARGDTFAAAGTISLELGISVRTVERALAELADQGIVTNTGRWVDRVPVRRLELGWRPGAALSSAGPQPAVIEGQTQLDLRLSSATPPTVVRHTSDNVTDKPEPQPEPMSPSALDTPRGEGRAEADLDVQVDLVSAVLREAPGLDVTALDVRQVLEAWPDGDGLAAARVVVDWAARGGLRQKRAARLLSSALTRAAKGLDDPPPARRPSRPPVAEHTRRRSDALQALLDRQHASESATSWHDDALAAA